MVPFSALSNRGAQSNLEHVAQLIRCIVTTAVPDAVVQEKYRTGRADDVLLPAQILIAANAGFADDA